MRKTKVTLRIDPEALETARQYARRYGTTVSRLVENPFLYFSQVEHKSLETPILNELADSLSDKISLEDYHVYLEEKYFDNHRNKGS